MYLRGWGEGERQTGTLPSTAGSETIGPLDSCLQPVSHTHTHTHTHTK